MSVNNLNMSSLKSIFVIQGHLFFLIVTLKLYRETYKLKFEYD